MKSLRHILVALWVLAAASLLWAQQQIPQSTSARALVFFMASSTDHVTGATGLSPTVTLSKNGGAFGAASGAVTEISSGWYQLAGNATDSNTLGALALHATATGADPADKSLQCL
jgi:hypothetical protein